jgi:hypothetical protein
MAGDGLSVDPSLREAKSEQDLCLQGSEPTPGRQSRGPAWVGDRLGSWVQSR